MRSSQTLAPPLTHSGLALWVGRWAGMVWHLATHFIFVMTFPSPLSVLLVSL